MIPWRCDRKTFENQEGTLLKKHSISKYVNVRRLLRSIKTSEEKSYNQSCFFDGLLNPK